MVITRPWHFAHCHSVAWSVSPACSGQSSRVPVPHGKVRNPFSALNKHVVLLLATAVLWSLGGVLIKSIDWTPIAIAGARSLIAMADSRPPDAR